MPKRKRNKDHHLAARAHPGWRRPGFRSAAVAVVALFGAAYGIAMLHCPPPQHSGTSHANASSEGTLPYTIPPRPELAPADDISPDLSRIATFREESFDVAESVVAALPDSAEAVCLLATVHQRHSNEQAAIRLWNACLQLDPQSADARQMLSKVAMEQGDYPQAELQLRQALRIDPGWAAIPPTLAEALAHQGKFQEAADVLERFQQRTPRDATVYCQLGEAYQHLEEFDKARECFQTALDVDPDCAEACYGLAATLRALERDVEADSFVKQFQQLQEGRELTTRQLRPNFDDVWRMRTTLVATHLTAARVYLQHGKSGAAERHCKRAAALEPEQRDSRELLCSIYVSRRDFEAALRVREELCQLVPHDPSQWLRMSILNYQVGRLEAAVKAGRELIRLAPERAEGYLILAQILMSPDKNPREAVQLARKGVKLAATAPNYHILATVCESVGDVDAARAALARSVQLDPQNVKYQHAYRRLQLEHRP